ncbi:MAG: type II toxin-antitoxin system MqsA family antitoxin [Deltaproteobacteria bacterium]|nr:type II toxin-antitoxin system MqsA family antitoxin [Deltaproteobacteria bacterium]
MRKCVRCGRSGLQKVETEQTLTAAGRTFTKSIEARRCGSCGETYLPALALARLELEAAYWLTRNQPAPSGEAFRFVRKALGLPGNELAHLLGVAPATLCRWEKGKMPVQMLPWAFVALLVSDELAGRRRTRDVLETMRQARPPSKGRVRLPDLVPEPT